MPHDFMTTAKPGMLVTVRGVQCKIVKVRPMGTIDVVSLDGDHAWRISGLPDAPRIDWKRLACPGMTLEYTDGRQGHCNVKAVVLTVDSNGMNVQFEDRADSTYIRFQDEAWIQFLRVV